MSLLSYLFRPNPSDLAYGDSTAMLVIGACIALVILSFVIHIWRRKSANAMVRKLGKSWSSAAFWFGIVGLVLIVSRIENIQFVAMRFLWVLWAIAAILFAVAQLRIFRAKNYQVLPRVTVNDPRAAYLPEKKRR